ncbi:hypothetical protein F5Y17DRAFT_470652 [Xylariaceae sp. FL0594]|nr:hypothetical protein F5Y17DRAFT_470652 [Xylariaceae sp. FL0594]
MRFTSLLIIIAAAKAGLGLPTVDNNNNNNNNDNSALCPRRGGRYDVCDTVHSFVTCAGHEAVRVSDCRVSNSTFCRVVADKGRCDGTVPPVINHEPEPKHQHPQPRPFGNRPPTTTM